MSSKVYFINLRSRTYEENKISKIRNLFDHAGLYDLIQSDRTIRDRVKKWINTGFLVPRDEDAKRIRSVTLTPPYQKLAEQIRHEPDKYKYLLK